MKIFLVLLTFYGFSSFLFANDGIYLTNGGSIYPIKETKISIEREILSFTVLDGICTVDIYFEFNNPDKVNRKLQVGFQAPTAVGDVDSVTSNTNQISNFTIFSEVKILPYQLKIAECEDCELHELEPKYLNFNQGDRGVFVYLFNIDFKPGINKVSHSYSFPASKNVAVDEIYNYILTTGSKWSGSTIKNLTVQFDLGSNCYFYVHDVFGNSAKWSFVGVGKFTNEKIIDFESENSKMIRIVSGKLQIDVANFQPKKNIQFGIARRSSFCLKWTDLTDIEEAVSNRRYMKSDDSPFTKEELRIIRNTLFAQYGFVFSSKDLDEYFRKFEWYIPNPNLKQTDIELTKEELEFLTIILQLEKE
jgi:hypothetical protein